MKLHFETAISLPFLEIKPKFDRELFAYLKPPAVEVEVERFDGCLKGDEIHLQIKLLGNKQKWVSLITQEETTDEHWLFVDEGKVLPWPISSWRHIHKVQKVDEQNSKIIDDITYECKPQSLGFFAAPMLWLSFAIRPYKYQQYFRK